MPADDEPKVAGASQRQCKDQADDGDAGSAYPIFAAIQQVQRAEPQRKDHRGGPEADGIRQRKLQVSAKRKLLEKPNQKKKDKPEDDPLDDRPGRKSQAAERVPVKKRDAA